MQSQLHRSGLLRFNEMILSLRFTSDEINHLLYLLKESDSPDEKELSVPQDEIPDTLLSFFEPSKDPALKGMMSLSPLFDRKTFSHHLNTLERNYQQANQPVMFYEQATSPQEFLSVYSQLGEHVSLSSSKGCAK